MLALALLSLIFLVPADMSDEPTAPGDGLVLSPTATVVSPVRLSDGRAGPMPGGFRSTGFGGAVGLVAIAGGVAISRVHRRRDDEPFFVVVHGNGGNLDDFEGLLDKLGVSNDRFVAFDYTDADGGTSSTESSRSVSTRDAAASLDELIRGLARDYSNIYSIHHSRGGAVGVSMIGALDDGSRPPIDGYVGAALLDPAIGIGWLGRLQRLGSISGLLPDNGGFDAIRCDDDACIDVRANLGEASGVEVIAIRNPDAEITNFRDEPGGLRVFDLVYDGGAPALLLLPVSPFLSVFRIMQAHKSVLTHDAVVACITAEVAAGGSCVWNDGRRRTPVWTGSGWGGGGGRVMLE